MQLIYICSPYWSEDPAIIERNLDYARELTHMELMRGDCPVASHLYMTQCLDDSIPEQRKTGLEAGQELVKRCDGVIVGCRFGISAGMREEIRIAKENGIPVRFIENLMSAT